VILEWGFALVIVKMIVATISVLADLGILVMGVVLMPLT
jgi:hypothetical protein